MALILKFLQLITFPPVFSVNLLPLPIDSFCYHAFSDHRSHHSFDISSYHKMPFILLTQAYRNCTVNLLLSITFMCFSLFRSVTIFNESITAIMSSCYYRN